MPTVDRVLPWRRNHQPPADEVAPLLNSFRQRHPKAPTALITRAYLQSADAHSGQSRDSGEPYVQHPLAVARIVSDLGLDDVTIAAALLHDTVEDTGVTLDDVGRSFGGDVAAIVDGVTKLDRVQFDSKEAQQAATMRKMLVAMAKDLRVLIIKLADRPPQHAHHRRAAGVEAGAHRPRDARHLRPLAHRLGMQDVKPQLEDLAFAALHPKRYAEIDHMVSVRTPERDLYLAQVLEEVRPPGRARHRRRGDRPPEAPLLHLREDGGQGPRVRRHLRPGGHAGRRRVGEGLLRGPRLDPRHVEAGAGPVQGLHGHAQVQPLPVAAHDGDRAAGQGPRGADPHLGDARPGRAGVAAHWAYKEARPQRQRPAVAQPHRRLAVRRPPIPTSSCSG